MSEVSTKPYLIRAIHEWCVDNGYTPYLAVSVNSQTLVPPEHVKAGEIVLNVSPLASNKLEMGNEWIQFQARFSGRVQDIMVPVAQVSAIYARENGHGMAFDVPKPMANPELEPVQGAQENTVLKSVVDKSDSPDEKTPKKPASGKKSHLTRVK
ncbi:MAG TPA: ClpXP protease specificity-enhancing factor [Limnobacter sp.]|uniref:ClpXP protease specificity-enhancing factor n=1 Tax=Limnobacter sp. TaxID=2003368 RepID=UPI002E2FC6C2|nr:ClpXP protease specificity-enhancing factor [Limnobacter sp.]HEX5485185.1 ClpXP protease specificity-enhancing factor [Limnobacter sp.]